MRVLTLSLLAPLLIAACSVSHDKNLAEGEVVPFHERLDGGKFEEIYDGSSQELKSNVNKEEFFSFLSAVHRKLGAVKTVSPRGSMVTINTSGTFVQLQYETAFEEGKGIEYFTFKVEGKGASLAGYHINSMALITK